MKPSDWEFMKLVGLLSTVGVAMVIATFLGLAFGVWVDRKAGTSPLFTLLFLVIGIAAGMWNFWKLAGKATKNRTAEQRDDRK